MGGDSRGADRPPGLDVVRHIPHVVIDGPWDTDSLSLSDAQQWHLSTVLRIGSGERISYTDGQGRTGEGVLKGPETVVRGEETTVPRPLEIVVAVAPPTSKDRQRFLVEKLAEMGVEQTRWLRTVTGSDRLASGPKLRAWARSGLEQSRGSWEMRVNSETVSWNELERPLVVCHPGGEGRPSYARTVVIGPEGGLTDDEIPVDAELWDLGPTVLRVETAAVVAVARLGETA